MRGKVKDCFLWGQKGASRTTIFYLTQNEQKGPRWSLCLYCIVLRRRTHTVKLIGNEVIICEVHIKFFNLIVCVVCQLDRTDH